MDKQMVVDFIRKQIASSKKTNSDFTDDQHKAVVFDKTKKWEAFTNEELEEIKLLTQEMLDNNK